LFEKIVLFYLKKSFNCYRIFHWTEFLITGLCIKYAVDYE